MGKPRGLGSWSFIYTILGVAPQVLLLWAGLPCSFSNSNGALGWLPSGSLHPPTIIELSADMPESECLPGLPLTCYPPGQDLLLPQGVFTAVEGSRDLITRE